MLRIAGHCLLFLMLASCGGYIINSNLGQDDSIADIADIIESPHLKNIHLQPVLLSDLKRQLKQTKNYHDFLRIFLSKKDVTNDIIDDVINGIAIRDILGTNQEKRRSFYSDETDGGSDEEMQMDEEADRLDEELAAGWYHTEEMEESPLGECRTPRPEIINVYDDEGLNRIFLPECTIVHRCRNVTGCCGSSNFECGPKYISVIERTFIVISKFGDDKAMLNNEMVSKKLFINHTECECQERHVLPNCDKYKCPYPFSMSRKGINCTCECQESGNEINFLCNSYKNGEIQLQETDLECIKCGKCLKPTCATGSLNVASGFCPKPDAWQVWNTFEQRLFGQSGSRHFSERSNSDPEPERSRVNHPEMVIPSRFENQLEKETQFTTHKPELQSHAHRETERQDSRNNHMTPRQPSHQDEAQSGKRQTQHAVRSRVDDDRHHGSESRPSVNHAKRSEVGDDISRGTQNNALKGSRRVEASERPKGESSDSSQGRSEARSHQHREGSGHAEHTHRTEEGHAKGERGPHQQKGRVRPEAHARPRHYDRRLDSPVRTHARHRQHRGRHIRP